MCSIYVHFNNVALSEVYVASGRVQASACSFEESSAQRARSEEKKKMVIFGNMSGILTVHSLSEETSTSINILLKNEHVHRKLL